MIDFSWMQFRMYANPQGAGWRGWIEVKTTGKVLAFVRLTGETVWDW